MAVTTMKMLGKRRAVFLSEYTGQMKCLFYNSNRRISFGAQ